MVVEQFLQLLFVIMCRVWCLLVVFMYEGFFVLVCLLIVFIDYVVVRCVVLMLFKQMKRFFLFLVMFILVLVMVLLNRVIGLFFGLKVLFGFLVRLVVCSVLMVLVLLKFELVLQVSRVFSVVVLGSVMVGVVVCVGWVVVRVMRNRVRVMGVFMVDFLMCCGIVGGGVNRFWLLVIFGVMGQLNQISGMLVLSDMWWKFFSIWVMVCMVWQFVFSVDDFVFRQLVEMVWVLIEFGLEFNCWVLRLFICWLLIFRNRNMFLLLLFGLFCMWDFVEKSIMLLCFCGMQIWFLLMIICEFVDGQFGVKLLVLMQIQVKWWQGFVVVQLNLGFNFFLIMLKLLDSVISWELVLNLYFMLLVLVFCGWQYGDLDVMKLIVL